MKKLTLNKKVTLKKMNVGDVIKLKDHEHTILRSNVIFNDEGTIVKIEKNESNQVEYVHVKLKNKNEWLHEGDNCLIFDNQDVDSQSIEVKFETINNKGA